MGVHNRITEEKYNKIKSFINSHTGQTTSQLDDMVIKEFGVCATTARNIRNTKDYNNYLERVFRYHGNPGHSVHRSPQEQARQKLTLYEKNAIEDRARALYNIEDFTYESRETLSSIANLLMAVIIVSMAVLVFAIFGVIWLVCS